MLNKIHYVILFVAGGVLSGGTPDSTPDVEAAEPEFDFGDLDFSFLQPATGTQDEIGLSQLPGAPPSGTQEPAATQEGPQASQVAAVGSSMGTPVPDDARRRQIGPPDPLTYPRDQTRAGARALRRQQPAKKRRI